MSDKFAVLNKKKSLLILLALTLVFIWGNSALPANISSVMSDSLAKLIGSFWTGVIGQDGISNGHLRKFAHAFEYACLGIEIIFLIKFNLEKYISSAFLFGLLTALIDETIQLFSEGRSSQVKDVWIDMLGFSIGFFFLFAIFIISKNRKSKKSKKSDNVSMSSQKGDDDNE